MLTAPVNGAMTGSNFYQDMVIFSCVLGYELEGSATLACQVDATWSGSVPTCTRIECPMLLPPINGGLSGTNFYMDTVVFTCDVGYDLIGDPSSTCQADRSWSSNVPSCSDIDECLNANGGCDHACTNTAGSFYCSCVAGFTLNEDRFFCDDINECNFGNGGCQHNCHNVIGSFQCSCMIGYELSADGFACCDVNECSTRNGGCQQTCTNVIGSFACSCQNGYTLNNDGFNCDDVDECASGNGGCEQTCTNFIPSFQCSCDVGYGLNADGFGCDDVNECFSANGGCGQTCTNSVGSFQCSCEIGYSSNDNGVSCDEINECDTANGGCSHICNNSVGSFECFCNTGYALDVDGFTCSDINECDTASGGCDQFCNNTIGSFNCYCATGYSLRADRLTCTELPSPTNISVSQASRESVVVRWSKPTRTLVLGYKVWLTDKETMIVASSRHLPQSAVSAAFTSLVPATEYVVAVSCISEFFQGPQADVTMITETDPPFRLFVDNIHDSRFTLFWTQPIAKLIGYELKIGSLGQQRKRRSTRTVTLPGYSNNYVIQDLVPATQYVLSLTAVSQFGRSKTITTTGTTGTDPPSDFKVHKVSALWVYVKWTPPIAVVISYQLEVVRAASQNEMHFSVPKTLTAFNITALDPTTKYTIRITAVSMYGSSDAVETHGSTLSDSTTDLKRFHFGPLETTTMSATTASGYDIKYRTSETALSLLQMIQRMTIRVEQLLKEETSSESVKTVVEEIENLFQLDPFLHLTNSSSVFPIELEAGVELFSMSSELIRASQGTRIPTMETLNEVVAQTVSRLFQILPVGNLPDLDTSVHLFKMEIIDIDSIDVSPKQQLKNVKDAQLKFHLQLRKAGLSLTNAIGIAADALLAILPDHEDYNTAFKSDSVTVVVARFTSGKTVIVRGGLVNVSSSFASCSLNGSIDATMVVMDRNLFSWNGSTFGQNVTTPVISFLLGHQGLDNCTLELDLSIPIVFGSTERPKRYRRDLDGVGFGGTQLSDGGTNIGWGKDMAMAYHAYDVPAATTVVVMHLSWWDHAAAYRVFFRHDALPTEELYDDMETVMEEEVVLAWHRETGSSRTWIPNIDRRRGKLYVGIQKTGPESILNTAPSTNDYKLQASTVMLELSKSAIRCNCSFSRPKAVIGGSVHPAPNSIDFDKIFENSENLSENGNVFYVVIGEWALYLLFMVIVNVDFQRLLEKIRNDPKALKRKDNLEQLSVLPPDRMPASYLYQITVNTGSMFGAGTSARIGFQVFGSKCKTAVKMLNPRGESLLRGGSYDFIMPVKKPLGHLELLQIWHDSTGRGDAASWFLREIIVKDLQTERTFSKTERLSCCWAVANAMMVASAMWYRDENNDSITNIVYNLGFVRFRLQILLLALLAAWICNTTPSSKQRTYEVKKDELHLHLLERKAPEKVHSPGAASVQRMKRKNEQRRKFHIVLREYTILFLLVVVLFFISQQDKDPFAFNASQTLSSTLTKGFNSITTPGDFWAWSEKIFLPVLYPSSWYNGWKMKYLDRQFPLHTQAFRIGPPRFIQIRDTAAHATSTLSDLQRTQWIDQYTKWLVLELSLYYPSRKLFSSLQMTVHKTNIGHISTSATVRTYRLFQYENTSDYGVMIAHILFIVFFLANLIMEAMVIKEKGMKYFFSIWNLISFVSIIGSAVLIWAFGMRYHFASEALKKIVEATG
uniref:Uncharacterized protein n=1 Tax=Branchiostoma floridae TaxID=7739 RepID=C3YB42_BRAFL|eukprot:XP_002606494.1 hypothetical protein BRAFLDRAFT_91924 [Branchiostoma floridae]